MSCSVPFNPIVPDNNVRTKKSHDNKKERDYFEENPLFDIRTPINVYSMNDCGVSDTGGGDCD